MQLMRPAALWTNRSTSTGLQHQTTTQSDRFALTRLAAISDQRVQHRSWSDAHRIGIHISHQHRLIAGRQPRINALRHCRKHALNSSPIRPPSDDCSCECFDLPVRTFQRWRWTCPIISFKTAAWLLGSWSELYGLRDPEGVYNIKKMSGDRICRS